MGEDNLLVNELLERIKFYKTKCAELAEDVYCWKEAYYDIKAEYEPITQQMPYYDTAVGPSPTLDNLVDLEKKLKENDTVGC